jgi:hypothetical protein
MHACALPGWASLSAGGIKSLVLPPSANMVVLARVPCATTASRLSPRGNTVPAGVGWSRAPLARPLVLALCAGDRANRGSARLSGVWLLNGSYQWACTSLAREEDGVPWLARTLDWPFPGLGRHTDVVHAKGPAGEYFSITWPGYAGVLTAMAPCRFAACINQAPMWRRTRHPWLRFYDLAANALHTW